MEKQKYKLFLLFFLFLCIIEARAQTISRFEYWFNDDFNSRISISQNSSEVVISDLLPVTLAEGLHFVHFRAIDSDGLYSAVHTQVFCKLPVSATGVNVTSYEYWVDDDFESRISSSATGSVFTLESALDMSSFSEGLHFLHVRAKDGTNRWSTVHTQAFYKLPASASGVNVTGYEYWVDDDFESRISSSATGSVFTLESALDMGSFSEGLHFLHLRAKDGTNKSSTVLTQAFYKHASGSFAENKISAYRYWFDDLFGAQQQVDLTVAVNVLDLSTDIDVPDNFAKGETHVIHFQSKDLLGRWSVAHTDTFVINLSTTLAFESETLKVYPNPFESYLTIENTSAKAVQQLNIIDATGRIVYRAETIQGTEKLMLNIFSDLSPGVYTLRYQIENDIYRKKLLKR